MEATVVVPSKAAKPLSGCEEKGEKEVCVAYRKRGLSHASERCVE